MPFDQAKQHFETQTNKAPAKVEEGWAAFRNGTINYFGKKQREVARFIDKLDYPGKENDESKYSQSMSKALDNLIDDDEATKKEMAQYRGKLRGESEQLKQKFLREKRKIEIRETTEKLQPVVSSFHKNGLKLNIKNNVLAYLAVPKQKQIPISQINTNMAAILGKASSVLPANLLKKNRNILYAILNHYSAGNGDLAKKETVKFQEQINVYAKCENVKNQTGLKLENSHIRLMMVALVKSGVDQKNVDKFIIQNIQKLRNLDSESFDQMISKMNSAALGEFLLTAIISVSEGKGAKAIEGIKMTLKIEGTLRKRQSEVIMKLKKVEGYLQEEVKELQEYMKKHPNVTIDKKIATLKKDISESIYSRACRKKDLLCISVQRSLANSFLSKKGINPSLKSSKNAIDAILNAQDSEEIRRVAGDQCGIFKSIPQMGMLKAAELEMGVSKEDFIVKEAQAMHLKHFLQFYETGKMSFETKQLFTKQFEYQAGKLEELLDKYEGDESDYAQKLKSLVTKYGDISKVPQNELQNISMEMVGYLNLLKTLGSTNIKYIGTLESLSIVSPSDEIKKKILNRKKIAKMFNSHTRQVQSFMGMKFNEVIAKDTDSLIESPLFGPMIQKEIAPLMNGLEKHGNEIQEAAAPLSGIGKRIEYRIKHHKNLVTWQFNQEIGNVVGLATTMKEARTNAINSKNKIQALINDKNAVKGMPQSMRLKRKKYLQNVISKLKAALNDSKSPLSLAGIAQVQSQVQKLVDSRDKYIREGFWRGIATTAILVGAVCTAVAGGWALAAGGKALFGTAAMAGVSTGVSSFAIGSMSMVGVAAGSTLGSRLVMQGFDSAGLVNFGGKNTIWKLSQMQDDMAFSLMISIAAVGSAKVLIKGLSKIATSQSAALRFPGLVKFSRSALVKMKTISKFANPSEWFEKGSVSKQRLLRHFAGEVVEETEQETLENIAGKIHPMAEFLVSVAGSADGMNMDLATQGVKASDIGITIEEGKMTYTTVTAQEFVSNLKTSFAQQTYMQKNVGTQSTYKTQIDVNGVVTIFLTETSIDPKTGKRKQRKHSTIRIHPSRNVINVSSGDNLTRQRNQVLQPSMQTLNVLSESKTNSSDMQILKQTSSNNTKLMDVLSVGTPDVFVVADIILKSSDAEIANFIHNNQNIVPKLSQSIENIGFRDIKKVKQVFNKVQNYLPNLEANFLAKQTKSLKEMLEVGHVAMAWLNISVLTEVFPNFKNEIANKISHQDSQKIIKEVLSGSVSVYEIGLLGKTLLAVGVEQNVLSDIVQTEFKHIFRKGNQLNYAETEVRAKAFMSFVESVNISSSSFIRTLSLTVIHLKDVGNPYLAAVLTQYIDSPILQGELDMNPFEGQTPSIEKVHFMGEAWGAFQKISVKDRQNLTVNQLHQKILSLMPKQYGYALSLKQRKVINDFLTKYKKQQTIYNTVKNFSKDKMNLWLKGQLNQQAGTKLQIENFNFDVKFTENAKTGPQMNFYVPREIYVQVMYGVENMQTLSQQERQTLIKNAKSGGWNLDILEGMVNLIPIDSTSTSEVLETHEGAHRLTKMLGIRSKYQSIEVNQNPKTSVEVEDAISKTYQRELQYIGDEIISYTKDGMLAESGVEGLFLHLKSKYFNKEIYNIDWVKDGPVKNSLKGIRKEIHADFEVAVLSAIRNADTISKYSNGFNMMRIANVTQWGKIAFYVKNKAGVDIAVKELRNENVLGQNESAIGLFKYEAVAKLKAKKPFSHILDIKGKALGFDANGKLKVYENKQAINTERLMLKAAEVRETAIKETLDILGVKGRARDVVKATFFDKMTGLLNRNGLALADSMLRDGEKVSFLSYDADHMKANNEIKGEVFGDKVIELIGKSKNEMVADLRSRGYDVYGVRMGGEEIVVFGTVPKEVLHKAEVARIAKLKVEIRSTLTSTEKANMAEFISKSKYANDPDGYNKAYNEIGGSTAAVVEVDGSKIQNHDEIAKKAIMMADAFLETSKNKTGRGQIILDKRRAGSEFNKSRRQEVENFVSKNELGEKQNENLIKRTQELITKANNQFNSRLKLLNRLKLSSRERAKMVVLLKSPKDTDAKVISLLQSAGVNRSDIEMKILSKKLQAEYFAAIRDHGNYTGASTMLYLDSNLSGPKAKKRFERKNVRNLEIGEFKSVNETLGHTGGDAFLTFVYQDVMRVTAKRLGIPDSQIIISQKGSNFRYVISSQFLVQNPGIQGKFAKALTATYKIEFLKLVRQIDAGKKGKGYQAIRSEWIHKNKQDTVAKSLKDQEKVFVGEVEEKK